MERRNGMSIVVPILLACSVLGGFLYVALDEGGHAFEVATFEQTPSPAQSDIAVTAVPPTLPATALAPPVLPPPAALTPRSGPESREVLAQLEKTCRYWSQRTGAGASSVMREAACNRMREFAQQHGLKAVETGLRPVRVAKNRQRRVSVDPLRRYEGLCDRHGYRTIEYRRCRADVKDQLKRQCEQSRATLKTVRGDAYLKLKDEASEICSVSRRYMIVD